LPLCDLAEQEIVSLAAAGVHCTPKEVVWLNDLGCEVENPAGRTSPALAGEPVRMGKQIMWPFTVASGEFWGRLLVKKAFESHDGSRNALAFTLCNGRNPEVFDNILTVDDARQAVNDWTMRCGATAAERESAIVRCVPDLAAPHVARDKRAKPADPDASDNLVAELEAGSGLPADYWRGQLQTHAVKCLRAIYRQSALGVGGVTDEGAAEYREANMRFMLASRAIVEAHRGES
jgi:hypothetical protein